MNIDAKLLSVCIPAYNRPSELFRLLESIDCKEFSDVEIIICEDKSPKREDITKVVKKFIEHTNYQVIYCENIVNYGYDKNLQELISKSKSSFITFMGDDDVFVPGALIKLIKFLRENRDLGYVLKSHQQLFKNGNIEYFRYYSSNIFFPGGVETYVDLFRKSVFISGFTINRNYIQGLQTSHFDGTLLYQLYLLSEVALNHRCAYFNTILTEGKEEGVPYFGGSESEKGLYTPGEITIKNSINFLNGFFKITRFIDKKYRINSTKKIKIDMSKYFYPSLAIQRDKGIKVFFQYLVKLHPIGFGITIYYYIYIVALVLFGKARCDSIIVFLKKILGRTPSL